MTTTVPLRRIASMSYGDALPGERRLDGNVAVFSSGGVTGTHNVSNTRHPCIVVGRKGSHGSVWWSDGPVFVIDTAYLIDERKTNADLRWLYYVLQSLRLGDLTSDVGVPGLSREKAYAVPVPAEHSIEEQRQIADFLDDQVSRIDNIIAARRQQVDRLSATAAAEMQEIVDELSRHQGDVRLRHVLVRIEQGWSPQADSAPALPEQWGVMKSGCVNGGVFAAADNKSLPDSLQPRFEYEIKPGDLLVSRASGSPDLIGSAAVVPGGVRSRLLMSDKLYRLRLMDGWNPWFVAGVLQSQRARQAIVLGISGAAGMANNLPSGIIKNLRVPNVSQSDQDVAVEAMRRSHNRRRRCVSDLTRSIELLTEYKQSLITAAVTGAFDVSTASGRGAPA